MRDKNSNEELKCLVKNIIRPEERVTTSENSFHLVQKYGFFGSAQIKVDDQGWNHRQNKKKQKNFRGNPFYPVCNYDDRGRGLPVLHSICIFIC